MKTSRWSKAATTLGELHVVGEVFHGAVEKPARFQGLDQALEKAEILHATPLGKRERKGLQVVVTQHEAGDLVGHLGQQRVARIHRQASVTQRDAQRDLDIDLHIGGVDAGGIVDGVGVEPHPAQRRLDAAALGRAKIGALADHLGADLGAGDADRVVAAVADRVVALR